MASSAVVAGVIAGVMMLAVPAVATTVEFVFRLCGQ